MQRPLFLPILFPWTFLKCAKLLCVGVLSKVYYPNCTPTCESNSRVQFLSVLRAPNVYMYGIKNSQTWKWSHKSDTPVSRVWFFASCISLIISNKFFFRAGPCTFNISTIQVHSHFLMQKWYNTIQKGKHSATKKGLRRPFQGDNAYHRVLWSALCTL